MITLGTLMSVCRYADKLSDLGLDNPNDDQLVSSLEELLGNVYKRAQLSLTVQQLVMHARHIRDTEVSK